MAFTAGHIPLSRPTIRVRRAIEAQVPQKALRDLTNRLRFGADAPQSDERLYADPRAIVTRYHPDLKAGAPKFRRNQSGQVLAGNWDLSTRPVEDNLKLQSCRMHFEDGVDWHDTPLIQRMKQQIEAGEVPDECKTLEEIEMRYSRLDRIFEQTRDSGRLKPREETPDSYRREHGGILVHVARDGTMLRAGGGSHRFAVAWILGLPEIPVQLGVIHREAVRRGFLKTLRLPLSQRPTAT